MRYTQDSIVIKRLLKRAFLQIDYTGNIDQKIESILVKLAKEMSFEEAIKGKKFVNPKTKNKVNFSSLPAEEQKKIRGQFEKKESPTKEEGVSEKLTKEELDLVKKYRKPEEKLSNAEKQEVRGKVKKRMEEQNERFDKDPKYRAEVVGNLLEGMESPEAKGDIVAGIKKFVNAEDFSDFGKALRNKDTAGMKKVLPGMLKGMLKGVLGVVGGAMAIGAVGMAAQNATTSVLNDTKDDFAEDMKEKIGELDENIKRIREKFEVEFKEEIEAVEEERKNEQMNKSMESVFGEIKDFKDKLESLNGIDALLNEDAAEIYSEEIEKHEQKIYEVEESKHKLSKVIDNIDNQLEELEEGAKDYPKEREKLEMEEREVSDAIEENLKKEQELKEELEKKGVDLDKFDEHRKSKSEVTAKLAEAKEDLAFYKEEQEKYKILVQNLDANSDEFYDAVQKLKDANGGVGLYEDRVKNNEALLKDLESKDEEVLTNAIRATTQSKYLKEDLIALDREHSSLESKRVNLENSLIENTVKTRTYEVAKESLDFSKEQASNSMKEIDTDLENLSKSKKEDLGHFKDFYEANSEEASKLYDEELADRKEYTEKQIRRANMRKFSKDDMKEMGVIAEKLQKALCSELEKLKGKKEKKKNKKASRKNDTDFEIKFI